MKKNRVFLLGILVMVLVFGMTVVGCDDGTTGGDTALNGTWIGYDGGEIKLNNGSFETSFDGYPMIRGTYTTSGNSMTMTVTHYHGNNFDKVESKWYTRAELDEAFKASGISAFFDDEVLDAMFTSESVAYSVSGNTLTMSDGAGSSGTYTRK